MDTKLKEKWVKALRSGVYAQTAGKLAFEDFNGNKSFCCLGVLRDIEPTVKQRKNCDELLSQSCGITQYWQRKLAAMNDNGSPFTAIADYIEEKL